MEPLVVNERRLGLNRNTLATLMRAFHLKADHIVHLEDDTVPSPDALRYFEWGIDHLVEHDPKHTILLVSGYNKPKSEPTPEQSHLCNTRPIWTPWGWGVDRKRLVWLMTNWCTRNTKCFTCNFRSQYQRTRKELFPVLSRIHNIGYELGENSRTAEWYRANHRTPWVAASYGQGVQWSLTSDQLPVSSKLIGAKCSIGARGDLRTGLLRDNTC